MAKRKALRDIEQSVFTEEMLYAFAKDMKSRRIPLDRQTLSDDLVTGLRARILKDGTINMEASYHFGNDRPSISLGVLNPKDPDHISLTDAREVTKTVKALADRGVNPQDGLTRRLVRELLAQGVKWKAK